MTDISKPVVAVRPAASLILLRRGAAGLEVLVGRRAAAARAFPGATVFPGGKLEDHDVDLLVAGAGADGVARYAVLRETFEETGLLVTASGGGPPDGADVSAAREAVDTGTLRFADLLARWKVEPGVARLTRFAHWITPRPAPYRFDTAFFLVSASKYEAQAPLICAEFEQLWWAQPQALLSEHGRSLMTPTRHCLGVLAQSGTPEEAVEAARRRGSIDGQAARAAAAGSRSV